MPIITDPNISTTAGPPGNNEDKIYVARTPDLVLYEGGIRSRVLPEPKASTLTVICQIFSYCAFSAGRFPQSVVEVVGLLPPSF